MKRGYTLIELLTVLLIISIFIALLLSAVQKVRSSAAMLACQNRLRQLSLSAHSFMSNRNEFPIGTSRDGLKEPYPFLNWHARLLPYLEQDRLWKDIELAYSKEKDFLKVPPHYTQTLAIQHFACPSDSRCLKPAILPDSSIKGLTSYLGVNGLNALANDGILFLNSHVRSSDITDGLSNTILIGERPPAGKILQYGWWYAGWGSNRNGEADGHLGVRTKFVGPFSPGCESGPFEFKHRTYEDPCNAFQFWSLHSGGANFAFADGSVKFFSYAADGILPSLATRSGGDITNIP